MARGAASTTVALKNAQIDAGYHLLKVATDPSYLFQQGERERKKKEKKKKGGGFGSGLQRSGGNGTERWKGNGGGVG